MASFPQVSRTLNSKGVAGILNHLRNPNTKLRPIRSEHDNRSRGEEEEEDKRPSSHHSADELSRQHSEADIKNYAQDDDEVSVRSTASRRSESYRSNNINAPINYPPSIKAADQRAKRITSAMDGKAFLMDIDNKFEGQDQTISRLINQLNSIQVKVESVQRGQK